MLDVARDGIPLVGLLVLLGVAYAHPRGRVEAAIGILAAAAALATRVLTGAALRAELGHLLPVVVFLAAILVVADACRAEGVFVAIGGRLGGVRSRRWLLTWCFVAAAVVTTVLSLDATVVLLTPVVIAAGAGRAGVLTSVRLANSGSLLLPVSNLTSLLALHRLDLTFGGFALRMAPVWLVVLLVEYVALRVRYRRDLARPGANQPPPDLPLPAFPVVVVALMLVGFAVSSPFGVDPAWTAVAAAIVLATRAMAQRHSSPRRVAHSAHLTFGVFVLCLGVVVAALGAGAFGDLLARLVPHRHGLAGLLLVALLGAVLANLVNNLPATLLRVPLLAPLGTTTLLAALVGINIGSSMTWTGSLANLLWRRTLHASGQPAPSRDFHLVAAVASPVGIVLGVLVLDGWTRLIG